MLKERVKTAACLIAVLIAAVAAGRWGIALLMAAVSAGCAYEYSRLITKDNGIKKNLLLIVLDLAVLVCAAFTPEYTAACAVFGILGIFMSVEFSSSPEASDAVFLTWGFVYTGIFMGTGVKLALSEYRLSVLLPAFLSCVLCDTAAYFFGCAFGKHRFCEKVSPKKSWEGAVAGFVTSIVVFVLTYFIPASSPLPNRLPFCILGGAVSGIAGECGDLAASLVKRHFNVKDYSNAFPGHGGFLDRADSFLFVIPAVYVLAGALLGI